MFPAYRTVLLLVALVCMIAASTYGIEGCQEESNRTRRGLLATGQTVASLVWKAIGFVSNPITVFDSIRAKVDEATSSPSPDVIGELRAGFEQVDRNLKELNENIQSVSKSINKLGLQTGYDEEVKRIKSSFSTLRKFVSNDTSDDVDHYKDQFLRQTSNIESDLETLLNGLLGELELHPDIIVVIRDEVECHTRNLRNRTESFMGIINMGWAVYASYCSFKNLTRNGIFKAWYNETYAKVEGRLTEEIRGCSNEMNVTSEMTRILRRLAPSTEDLEVIKEQVSHFLSDKYHWNQWIVVVTKFQGPEGIHRSHLFHGKTFYAVKDEQGINVIAHSMSISVPTDIFFKKTIPRLDSFRTGRFSWFPSIGNILMSLQSYLGPLSDGVDVGVINLDTVEYPLLAATRDAVYYVRTPFGEQCDKEPSEVCLPKIIQSKTELHYHGEL